jgi:hypothetical protein
LRLYSGIERRKRGVCDRMNGDDGFYGMNGDGSYGGCDFYFGFGFGCDGRQALPLHLRVPEP